MTRNLGLFLLALLVCAASTNAAAQSYDLFWQHADGRRAVWTMDGTTRRSGELLSTELLVDPLADPPWQIVWSSAYRILFQHQGDGRLASWDVFCGGVYGTVELSPSQVPDLTWKPRGYAYFRNAFLELIWQNETTGQIAAWKMANNGTTRLDGRLLTPSEVPDTNWRIVGVADFQF